MKLDKHIWRAESNWASHRKVQQRSKKNWQNATWPYARSWYRWCNFHHMRNARKVPRQAKNLYIAFVDLKMQNAKIKVWINNEFSDKLFVNVCVHQSSVLGPLLFIIVLKAFSLEFRKSYLQEHLYVDSLAIIFEYLIMIQKSFDYGR